MNTCSLIDAIKEYKSVNNEEDDEQQELISRLYNTLFQSMITQDHNSLQKMCRVHSLKLFMCEDNYIFIMPKKDSKFTCAIVYNINSDCNKVLLEVPHLGTEEVEYAADVYFKTGNCKAMILSAQVSKEPRLVHDICYKPTSQFQSLHCLFSTLLFDHVVVQVHTDNTLEHEDIEISNGYGKFATLSAPKLLSDVLTVDHSIDEDCCNTNVQARSLNFDHDSGRFIMLVQSNQVSHLEDVAKCFDRIFVPQDNSSYKNVPSPVYNKEAPRPVTEEEQEAKRKVEDAKSEEEKKIEQRALENKLGRKRTVKTAE